MTGYNPTGDAPKSAKASGKRSNKVSTRLFKGNERRSAVDTVIDRFKQLLMSGALRSGDRIPSETELSISFQTSRSSVREAVKTLAGFGVLDVRHGDGTYISESMSKSLFDHLIFQLLATSSDRRYLIELRNILEIGVIVLATDNVTQEDMEAIEAANGVVKEMYRSMDFELDDLCEAETRFHFALSAATHNPLLEKLYNFTFELFMPSIRKSAEINQELKRNNQKIKTDAGTVHEAIVESLRRRDHKLAREAVAASLDIWIDTWTGP